MTLTAQSWSHLSYVDISKKKAIAMSIFCLAWIVEKIYKWTAPLFIIARKAATT